MIGKLVATLIIPARNEAQSIGLVLREVPPFFDHIIVVDNASTDHTDQIARACGAKVVYESHVGYGAACQAGIRHAIGDLIAFMDADYSDYPSDLEKVVAPVATGKADLAIGVRPPILPLHQRFGNWLACHMIYLLYGIRYADLGPMRCIHADTLRRLQMVDRDYGWTVEMQIKAARLDIAVVESPVRYRKRIGKSKISGTLRGSVLAACKILYWTVKLTLR